MNDELSTLLSQLYQDPDYLKAQELISRDFILSNKELFDENGVLIEDHWGSVREPITLNSKDWGIKYLKMIKGVEVSQRPVLFTLVRVTPPNEFKEILRADNRESQEYKDTAGEYSAALLSKEAGEAKHDIIRMLNEVVFNKRNYMLMPAKDMYGLLPQFDFDVILLYISVTSLKGQLDLGQN